MVVMQTMVRLDHLVILVGEAEVLVLLDQMDQQVVLAETEPHQQLLAHQQHMLAAVVREITYHQVVLGVLAAQVAVVLALQLLLEYQLLELQD
jgi:hypothetical protein